MTTVSAPTPAVRAPGPRYRNPLQFLRDMQEGGLDFTAELFERYGPLVEVRLFRQSMFLVKSPTAIRRILFTHADNYVKGSLFDRLKVVGGEGMFFSEGDTWLRSKKIIGPYFRRHNLDRYVNAISAAGDKTVQVIAKQYEGREFNLETLMAHTALDVVGRAFFGMEFSTDRLTVLTNAVNDAGEFSQKLLNSVVPMTWLPTEINRRGKRAVAVFYDVFDELIDEGLARSSGDDLLSLLLENVKSGAFDRKQLGEELWTIVNAGHETTATTMAVMLYHFAKDPSWQAEVLADIEEIVGDSEITFEKLGRLTKMDWTTKETLRLYPPASGTARQAVAEDTLDGFHVPKGAIVQASFHWMQRDSALWPGADEFRPARFADAKAERAGAYLPFGGGARRCLGEHFAYLEALIIVTKILQHYTVECRDDFVVEPYLRVATRMRNGVQLTLRRRAR